MALQHIDKCLHAFKIACILATIGTTCWSIYIFAQNSDVCLVDYIPYNQDGNSIYPSITIVVGNPFIKENLKVHGENITPALYSQFLEGTYWDDRMMNINYDDVTVDINDYLLSYELKYGDNHTTFVYEKASFENMNNGGWKLPYISYRGYEIKAFTIDQPFIKDRNVLTLAVNLKTSLFDRYPNKSRPQERIYDSLDEDFGSFEVYFHYPGQFLRSWMFGLGRWFWPKRTDDNTIDYIMELHVGGIDVLKLRNKDNFPCGLNRSENDFIIMEQMMVDAGCKPPQINSTQNLPTCSSKSDMKKVKTPSYSNFLKYPKPCESVYFTHFTYGDLDVADKLTPPQFKLEILHSHPTFKCIRHIKAFDAQSLIGNAGGYLGLFLGYALIQVPQGIVGLVRFFKNSRQVHFQ